MELSIEEFNDLVDDVLDIMMKSRDKEPSADDAVHELKKTHDVSDSTANSLANAAFFEWPTVSRGL